MRADAATRLVLQNQLKTMLLNEQGTIQGLDIKSLHDFRVSVRRTRSILSELKDVFPPATGKRFRREFSWLGKLTSHARDLDVCLLNLESYNSALPAKSRNDLDPLKIFLQDKKQHEYACSLAVQLQSPRYRKLRERWTRYLSSPLAERPTATDARKAIGVVARDRTWHMYNRVYREGKAITAESPNTDLHELRKSCKKLRYLMELFQTLYTPGAIKELIGELRQLQENLGNFQDLNVQVHSLEDYKRQLQEAGICSEATSKAIDLLLETLHQRMADIRAEFAANFERISRDEIQRKFEMIFHTVDG